ncbi:small membrane protein [Klebsiella pneumoniae]|nr:small membrane protein [Klebsiella pneumoniae]
MSGLILFIVAVALLGVAIYSLVSYLKERCASQLPVHKKKK